MVNGVEKHQQVLVAAVIVWGKIDIVGGWDGPLGGLGGAWRLAGISSIGDRLLDFASQNGVAIRATIESSNVPQNRGAGNPDAVSRHGGRDISRSRQLI